jgi:hypothetical protein
VIGYTLNIPDGWTSKAYEKGETVLECCDTSSGAYYNVAIKKLAEGVTAKDHLEYLESFMPASGYSENFMPEESRSVTGADAAAYNADDIYGGAYTKTKNGQEMVQMIFVYRKGQYAYLTIQTCHKDSLTQLQPTYGVFHNSFKLVN